MTKPMHLPRRTFMKAAAAFGGSTLVGGINFRAFAQATNLAPADRCFVFAYFSGGWDVLLSLDPRDPAVFTPERITETRILPGYNLLSQDPSFAQTVVTPNERPGAGPSNIQFGPAIGRMADHYDLMSVVRGINMTTVAHEVGFRYFLTGKEPNGSAARASSTATEVVGQMKPAVPVPQIAYGIESYNDRYPGYANALRVSSSNDLLLTLAPSPTQLDSEIEDQLVNLRGEKVTCERDLYDSRGLITQYKDSRSQMDTVLGGRLDNAFRFNLPENQPVRQTYGLSPDGPNSATASPAARAALVATALKKGISQCVSINISGGLDTHFGTQVTHAQNQRAGWNALGDLVTDLRGSAHPSGGNFMDHTTIVIFSEFSRTPMINAAGGRDHHITNSCMLLGAGIQHNKVFGRSGDVGMSSGVIDFDTGLSMPGGQVILPDHVIATVMAGAGLDYSIMRVEPMKGLLAT